jgi:hypothetical protein
MDRPAKDHVSRSLVNADRPRRVVHCADALGFMAAHAAPANSSVVTSLPDVSELSFSLDDWKTWFVDAAKAVMRWVPSDGVAIFFQSDIRHNGVWVDKGYLVQRAAEDVGATLRWHRIVCRKAPGTRSLGRPSYSHLLCFGMGVGKKDSKVLPDVLPDVGDMPWSRAMGVEACRLACEYLLAETNTQTVIDPFCGKGTLLAVANAMGLDAIGVELSQKRCRAARNLVVSL